MLTLHKLSNNNWMGTNVIQITWPPPQVTTALEC